MLGRDRESGFGEMDAQLADLGVQAAERRFVAAAMTIGPGEQRSRLDSVRPGSRDEIQNPGGLRVHPDTEAD